MASDSKEMTSFSCPFGKFHFNRMPFGLRNALAIFQSVVEDVLRPVSDRAANYIDDVIVFSADWEAHLKDLEGVVKCLGEAGFTIKPSKCEFGRRYMLYLGHVIGDGRMSVPEARISAMRNYRRPKTKKQLRAYLGSIGYYREFIPNFAHWSSRLSPSVSLSAPLVVEWSLRMTEAFSKLVNLLCDHIVLFVPDISDHFILCTDASGSGIGACLHVRRDAKDYPVAFYSRQLRGAESRYTVTELEAVAIVDSVLHFDFYLYGTDVLVYTGHRACEALVSGEKLNKRLTRMSLKLMDRNVTIVYRPGRMNENADGLSRQDWEEDFHPVSSVCYQPGRLGSGLAGGPVGSEPGRKKRT